MTALVVVPVLLSSAAMAAEPTVDFNRDIRPILSNTCFKCHGPDDAEVQAGLRLDTKDRAQAELDSGVRAVVPGNVEKSALIARVTADDPGERMPPEGAGQPLTDREVQLLTTWIREGGKYARHWSYERPVRPDLPEVQQTDWALNDIDRFILARLEREGLTPSEAADRYAIVRRVSLDLTGLPPTLEEVDRFIADEDPNAYERLVDRLLEKDTYGEHWARMWLDLARYADSAGYADDPPRTIWGYRDWVIRAINANMPFDQFTVEQLAGDLLPSPTQDQLVATAFHRNTLTNNEGGTNDEEYRNVAIVDRVNTTMAVWMGTTMACAQCHTHKFDPISQEEYFRFFAIFNNSEDADRRDESPLVQLFTAAQQEQKTAWQAEVAALEKTIGTATPELLAAQAAWEKSLSGDIPAVALKPSSAKAAAGASLSIADDGLVSAKDAKPKDTYTLELPLDELDKPVVAVQLATQPKDDGGNFVITRVLASVLPKGEEQPRGRYVRVELPGSQKILSLAEVEVFSGDDNIARKGEAKQSSTGFEGPPQYAIDGNTDGNYQKKSVTHTATEDNPWWEVDLKSTQPIDRVAVWNRTDNNLQSRLNGFRIQLLDENREVVWEKSGLDGPKASATLALTNSRPIKFTAAYADFSQDDFVAANVLDGDKPNATGWAVGSQTNKPHVLTLVPAKPVDVPAGSKLTLTIEQQSKYENHTLGKFRVQLATDPASIDQARTPANLKAIAGKSADQRSDDESSMLTQFFLGEIAAELADEREQLAKIKKQLADMKPGTSVPIMRQLDGDKLRTTKIQRRGNFLDTGKEVVPGLPSAFHAAPAGEPLSRLVVAKWLMDENNPLTARVIANRYWEAIFGIGLVRSSEEFGNQGELPSHPLLLDYLATELVRLQWDTKAFLKLLVTSATYRQTSRVTPVLIERDPDNRLLARGPRFRLSAEMVRDQALFVSGLLSSKMYGPPVKPMQPTLGINAAFGSGIDWKTSDGEDRYRRGLYTTWRRSNPYPSMAAFDAPNREVCTIRRDRTNTPLQALVTLNDPVYIEAAQSLSRRMVSAGESIDARATHGFRICVARPPNSTELARLVALYERAHKFFAGTPEQAKKMATDPLGAAPEGTDVAELAAWTVVGNVLLNLDEMFMKR